MPWIATALRAAAAAATLVLAGAQPGAAEVNFAGKTLTVYVGYSPGGGYDANGRLLAAHIGRFLPGHPDTLVKNMPGASSRKMMAYLYNVAARDGTEFGIGASDTAFFPLFNKETDAKYVPQKMGWIGSLDNFTAIGIAWHDTGLKTLDDAKSKVFHMTSSGAGSAGSVYVNMLNDMVGTKFKIVAGYRGSAGMRLAIERGEADGLLGWCWSCINADKPDWVKEHKVNFFLQLGLKKNPAMEGVPFIFDVLQKDEDKKTARVIFSNLLMARPFVGPPGIPAETLAALRHAFDEMVKDPQFLADAKKAHRPIKPVSGNEIESVLADVYGLPERILARAASYYK